MTEQLDKNGAIGATAVKDELARIVSSKTFRRANRMRDLLQYLVRGTLNGITLTEARTAREVFGKDENFDASIDPEVRIHCSRLRRKLAEYYASEGKESSIVIDLPSRRYEPVFLAKHSGNGRMPAEPAADQAEQEPQSIAVLPFANLTNDPAHDVFCYGLTEEIISGMAAEPAVNVVASSSAFQFKDKPVDVREAGEELGVQMILEGSVRMEDNQTRVLVRLARVNDGIAIWSDSFDAQVDGALSTQQSVAHKVMESLPVVLVRSDRPVL